jgi:hypothetical protein
MPAPIQNPFAFQLSAFAGLDAGSLCLKPVFDSLKTTDVEAEGLT